MNENQLKAYIQNNPSNVYEYINKVVLKDVGAISENFFIRLVGEYFEKSDKATNVQNITANTFGYYLITETLGEAKQAYPFFRKDTLSLEKIFSEAKVYFNHVKFTIEDNKFIISLIQTKAGVSTLEDEIIKYSKSFDMKDIDIDFEQNFQKLNDDIKKVL